MNYPSTSASCPSSSLEGLVFGELSREEAASVAAHAARCATCTQEIQALRAERAAVGRWAAREEAPLAPFDLSLVHPAGQQLVGIAGIARSKGIPGITRLAKTAARRRPAAVAAGMLGLVAAAGWLLAWPTQPPAAAYEPEGSELACREPPASWKKPIVRAIETIETCYAACMVPEPQGPLACMDATITNDTAQTPHGRSCE